jgi:hypothetical protein
VPEAPKRVATFVREREDAGEVTEDVVSEGILAEALLAVIPPPAATGGGLAPPPPAEARTRLEIVNRQTYEKALKRDSRALKIRSLDVDASILQNLAEVGVDILALGEIGTSGTDRITVGGQPTPQSFYVDATISLVRVDNATTLGVGTASAQRPTAREAKKEAIRQATGEALRRFQEPGDGVARVTLTVEALRGADDETQLEKALRSMKGILWVKPASFELGPSDKPSSVARFQIGWNGDPEELKKALSGLNPGFRLSGTLFEGSRWTFRAEPSPAAGPQKNPPGEKPEGGRP